MKQKLLLFSLLVVLVSCSKQESMDEMIDRVFYVAEQQYIEMDTRLDNKTMPQSIARDSTFKPSTIYWWCSGFYPGSLWYIYEYTQSDAVKLLAEKNTLKLDSIQYVTHDHDVGFQLNCSYGNGLRLTGMKIIGKCFIKEQSRWLLVSIRSRVLFAVGILFRKLVIGNILLSLII